MMLCILGDALWRTGCDGLRQAVQESSNVSIVHWFFNDVCQQVADWYVWQCSLGGGEIPCYDGVFDSEQRVGARASSLRVQGNVEGIVSKGVGSKGVVGSSVGAGKVDEKARSGVLLQGVRKLSGQQKLCDLGVMDLEERRVGLARVREEVIGCSRCKLSGEGVGRLSGIGSVDARLFFVCQGGDAQELEEGRIVAGESGVLMDNILRAIGLSREDVYFANVVCCVPAHVRRYSDEEMYICQRYLYEQIKMVQPDVIVSWGQCAYQSLFRHDRRHLMDIRGRWMEFMGIAVMPTFHPGYLLKNPKAKRFVWQDMQAVEAKLLELRKEK